FGLDRAALVLELVDVMLGSLEFGALFDQRLLAVEYRRPRAVLLAVEALGGLVLFLQQRQRQLRALDLGVVGLQRRLLLRDVGLECRDGGKVLFGLAL